MTLTYPLLDATWGTNHTTAPGFKAVWWTGSTDLNDSSGKYDPSQAVITNVAKVAENGGAAPVTGRTIAPGTPVFLDFESDETESVSWYVQRIQWFHEAAPNVKVGIWGLPIGWKNMTEDTVASDTPQVVSQIDSNLQAWAPVFSQLDMITLSAYLLGPTSVNTTFKWISVLAGEYHKIFAGKEVVCWMWGAYHTAWNPPNDVASDAVTQQYVQTALSSCDALLIWGSDADNAKIKQVAYQMDQAASSSATSADGSLFSDSSVTDPNLTSVIQ
jgi:hypothetical protein